MDSETFRRHAIELALANRHPPAQSDAYRAVRQRAMVSDGTSSEEHFVPSQVDRLTPNRTARETAQRWLTTSASRDDTQQSTTMMMHHHHTKPQRAKVNEGPPSSYLLNSSPAASHAAAVRTPYTAAQSSSVTLRSWEPHTDRNYSMTAAPPPPPTTTGGAVPAHAAMFQQLHRQLSDLRREYLTPPRRQAPVFVGPTSDSVQEEVGGGELLNVTPMAAPHNTKNNKMVPISRRQEKEAHVQGQGAGVLSSRSLPFAPTTTTSTTTEVSSISSNSPSAAKDDEDDKDTHGTLQTLGSLLQRPPVEKSAAASPYLSVGGAGGGGERVTSALFSRLQELEGRLNAVQTQYVRRQASRGLDADRCRRQLSNAEYRLQEVQAQLSDRIEAVAVRMRSAATTTREAAEETIRRLLLEMKDVVARAQRDVQSKAREDQTNALAMVTSMRHSLAQAERQHDVKLRELAAHFANTVRSTQQRTQAVQHVAGRIALPRSSVATIRTTLSQLAIEIRKQLAQLKKDRLSYEEHFIERVAKLAALLSQRSV